MGGLDVVKIHKQTLQYFVYKYAETNQYGQYFSVNLTEISKK